MKKTICMKLASFVIGATMALTGMAFSEANAISVGDHVYFGHYEQDNNRANGPEKIEWIVLAKGDGRALLISKDALDCKRYHKELVPMTWENCDLRAWLNSYFYKAAFTEKERERVLESAVPADKNPEYDTDPGNDTFDKVFLLSITEAQTFFAGDKAGECKVTPFAMAKGAWTRKDTGNAWWWLRSPGDDPEDAACVGMGGSVFGSGYGVCSDLFAVRPALWIHL